MRPPTNFIKILNRKKYDVSKAILLAGDDYWDGHNFERGHRNTFLYRTPKGAYFVVRLTRWQGESDSLRPLTLDEAIELYETALTEHRVSYEEAFPGVQVEDA